MKFDQPRRLSSTIALPRAVAHIGERVRGDRVQPGALAAHVEHLDGRQRAPVDAPRQARTGIAVHALRARGRAAGDQQRAAACGALGGDLAGVVARVPLVLVGGVVLLVDHDQAEVGDGREHRRARPDADPRLALAQPPPLLVALGRGHPRVQHGDGVAEARGEAREDLRRERDLRDQHDRAPPLRERRLGGPQVDLGLAGSGHPVQQRALGPPPPRARRAAARAPRAGRRPAPARARLRGADRAQARRRDRPPPATAQPFRGARRQHEAERAGEGRAVLGGDPAGELHELRGDPRLERAHGLQQPLARRPRSTRRARRRPPSSLRRAERHDEHRADRRALAQLLAAARSRMAPSGRGRS